MGARFSTMNVTRTPSDELFGGNQDFASCKLGGEVGYFKRGGSSRPPMIGCPAVEPFATPRG